MRAIPLAVAAGLTVAVAAAACKTHRSPRAQPTVVVTVQNYDGDPISDSRVVVSSAGAIIRVATTGSDGTALIDVAGGADLSIHVVGTDGSGVVGLSSSTVPVAMIGTGWIFSVDITRPTPPSLFNIEALVSGAPGATFNAGVGSCIVGATLDSAGVATVSIGVKAKCVQSDGKITPWASLPIPDPFTAFAVAPDLAAAPAQISLALSTTSAPVSVQMSMPYASGGEFGLLAPLRRNADLGPTQIGIFQSSNGALSLTLTAPSDPNVDQYLFDLQRGSANNVEGLFGFTAPFTAITLDTSMRPPFAQNVTIVPSSDGRHEVSWSRLSGTPDEAALFFGSTANGRHTWVFIVDPTLTSVTRVMPPLPDEFAAWRTGGNLYATVQNVRDFSVPGTATREFYFVHSFGYFQTGAFQGRYSFEMSAFASSIRLDTSNRRYTSRR